MNIWALNKDTNIKHLLLTLNEVFKPGAYSIIDSPDDDRCAVRLTNQACTDTVLYIFTYGQAESHYGVHIEYPNLQETNYYDTLESRENISFKQLVDIIGMKLEITQDMFLDEAHS